MDVREAARRPDRSGRPANPPARVTLRPGRGTYTGPVTPRYSERNVEFEGTAHLNVVQSGREVAISGSLDWGGFTSNIPASTGTINSTGFKIAPRGGSTWPNSPHLRRRQPTKAASHSPANRSGNPGTHYQPGVRVVAPMGHAGAWPLRPVVPCGGPPEPSQSATASGPTDQQSQGRDAQPRREQRGRPPPALRNSRLAPAGRGCTSPCPHTRPAGPALATPRRAARRTLKPSPVPQFWTVAPRRPARFRATFALIRPLAGGDAGRKCMAVLRHGGSAACCAGMASLSAACHQLDVSGDQRSYHDEFAPYRTAGTLRRVADRLWSVGAHGIGHGRRSSTELR